jgi:hypothetical protein
MKPMSQDKIPNQADLELETLCETCNGKGGRFDPDDGSGFYCDDCGGSGYMPTEFGKKVLAMIRHNFQPMYDKMRERD